MVSIVKESEDENDQHLPFRNRDFWLDIMGNAFFLLGSSLYIWVGVIYMEYEREILDIPRNISQADDDVLFYEIYNYSDYTDDYIIKDAENDIWISRYQIVYFFAALCFVITGVLECFNRKSGWLHIILPLLFIVAGGFGLLSAIFAEEKASLSAIFNSISVHLFLIEAIGLAYRHSTSMNVMMRWFVYFGDMCFVVGSIMDIVLSYFWVFDRLSYELSKLFIAAACLWLACAITYTTATIYSDYILMKETGKQDFALIATIAVIAIMALIATIVLAAPISLAATIALSSVISVAAFVSVIFISL